MELSGKGVLILALIIMTLLVMGVLYWVLKETFK